MKQFIIWLFALFAVAFPASAQWRSGTAAAGTTVLDVGSGQLALLTLNDTSGSLNSVILYDSGTTATNRVVPGFSGTQTYMTNIVSTWTNSLGVAASRTNSRLITVPFTVATVTNEATRLYSIAIPANGSITINPPSSFGYTYGLLLRNTGNLVYNGRILEN